MKLLTWPRERFHRPTLRHLRIDARVGPHVEQIPARIIEYRKEFQLGLTIGHLLVDQLAGADGRC